MGSNPGEPAFPSDGPLTRREWLKGGARLALAVGLAGQALAAPARAAPEGGGAVVYDVVIVGGGPAGLSAALALGRARRRVLILDAGRARNARAAQVHNFLTRDGTPPAEVRRLARAELAAYPSVELREARAQAVDGPKGALRVDLADGAAVTARRVLLCAGMVDELPDLPGYAEAWGRAIFQCPYCHAWEVRDRPFGFLAPAADKLEFGLFLRGWTSDVVVFTDGKFAVPEEVRARLERGRVRVEERPLRRLVLRGEELEAVELTDGARVERAVLFARPPQRQTDLVRGLGLTLDPLGFVQVSDQHETSRPGVFAAGDLTTPLHGAILAAAAGTKGAGLLNHALTVELVLEGA